MAKTKLRLTDKFGLINLNWLFYGWIIVIISAIALFFSGPGQTYSISIFIHYYINNFGWNRTLVSGYYSITTLIAGLTLPIVGKAIDARGHREMMAFTSIMLGLVCIWMSFITKPAMLIFGFFFLRLLGQGSMALIPSTLVPQWFIHYRGKALSFMSLGSIVASTLFPIINDFLINNIGVEFTWRIWAVSLIAFMAPIGWIFIRNKPEDIGCLPDGKISAKYTLKDIENHNSNEYSWTVKEAIRTRAFWLMLFCMICPSMINAGITFHMLSIIGEKGFSSTFAAFILSFIAAVQLPLTFIAGYLADRARVHHIKAINFFILLIAILCLNYSNSKKLLIVYSLLHGIFIAFDFVSTSVLWPNYFGRKHLGSIRSIALTAFVIGSALGPLPFGYAYDLFGGYKEILFIMMAAPALGSLAAFFSPAPKSPK